MQDVEESYLIGRRQKSLSTLVGWENHHNDHRHIIITEVAPSNSAIITGEAELSPFAGQQIRSKIESFQNANFLISEPNPMM